MIPASGTTTIWNIILKASTKWSLCGHFQTDWQCVDLARKCPNLQSSPETLNLDRLFHRFGKTVAKYWYLLLIAWFSLAALTSWIAPSFNSVVATGEFGFLPDDAESRVADAAFQEAFDKDLLSSLVVVVVSRPQRPAGLITTEETFEELVEAEKKGKPRKERRVSDFEFVQSVLKPKLEELLAENLDLASNQIEPTPEDDQENVDEEEIVDEAFDEAEEDEASSRIRTFDDKLFDTFLTSTDNKATLVTIELPNDFLDNKNAVIIRALENLIHDDSEFYKQVPAGLELDLSGTAVVGRDMSVAAANSAKATESLTVILVVILLVVIYRAPLLAIIPLVTVAIALQFVLCLIALLAQAEIVGAFSGLDIYVTVITYGAGVDYCLFLIARYKESLDDGQSYEEAIATSIQYVGAPLVGSAGTSIVGIGMMVFADFEKFQQAGVGISLGLFVALCASLTFTPALLRLAGKWAFWPRMRTERPGATPAFVSSSRPKIRWYDRDWLNGIWNSIGNKLVAHPVTIWWSSVALMLPFAVIAAICFNFLSYGLLDELSDESSSVVGAEALQRHFPAGTLGPTTVLLENTEADFTTDEYIDAIEKLTNRLAESKEQLHLADVRSISHPLGVTEKAKQQWQEELDRIEAIRFQAVRFAQRGLLRTRVAEQYAGSISEETGAARSTRLDLVFDDDPFSRNNISQLDNLEEAVRKALPEELEGKTRVYFLGPTASIRDLKRVTDSDQIRIDILVLIGVYAILVFILRKPASSAYLILSVFFSYMVTLGVTFVVFWALDPSGFSGLDWKVRMFLFTILIAIGEDYNIFLMTRIDEETKTHGHIPGIQHALTKTGSIISSCGIIMTGTFCSLMAGSLIGMVQLGFALAFGVMLDTFVIRPVVVPAFLIMLHQGRLGVLGTRLFNLDGAADEPVPDSDDKKGTSSSDPPTVS